MFPDTFEEASWHQCQIHYFFNPQVLFKKKKIIGASSVHLFPLLLNFLDVDDFFDAAKPLKRNQDFVFLLSFEQSVLPMEEEMGAL